MSHRCHAGGRSCTPWIALACLALGVACSGGEDAGALRRLREAGVLRWGADMQGGEPYVYENPAAPGERMGFEVDIAAALARELGVRAEFVQNDWSSLVPSLERGSFDITLNGLEVTPARAGRVLLTRPYYIFGERLMARRDDPSVTDLESLRGRRVGTLANSLAWDMLRRAGAEAVPYEGSEEPYLDLQQGRTDAVLQDDIIADRYGVPKQDLRVVGDFGVGYYSIAVRLGEEDLYEAVDDALERITKSGELGRILAEHRLDNERQAELETWSDEQTRQMTAITEHSKFGWHHVVLFAKGAGVTLLLSACAMALAIPLGLFLAFVRIYGPRPLSWLSTAYIEVFRGTPVLLQLYVLYFGLAAVVKIDAFAAAVLGLGLNYSAYEAEVYRAGIQAVPKGQMEAARSLGMSTGLAIRRILAPQAFRNALPSVTNDFIALLKDSSLVSVITVVELTKQMTITAVDVRSWIVPGALCALLYFSMSYPLSLLSQHLERKLSHA